MKLSSKTQYGLRILLQVAMNTHNGKLAQGRTIAAKQSINEPYLEQIMVSLKKSGLIQTVRGRRGGYLLACDPKQVSVLDVIEIFEGPVSLLDTARSGDSKLPPSGAIAGVLDRLTEVFREEADSVSLADIMALDRCRMPDYVI